MLLERNAIGGREGKGREGKATRDNARQGEARRGKARGGEGRQGKVRQGKAVFREIQLHAGFDLKPWLRDGSSSPITLRKSLAQGFLIYCECTRFVSSSAVLWGPGF